MSAPKSDLCSLVVSSRVVDASAMSASSPPIAQRASARRGWSRCGRKSAEGQGPKQDGDGTGDTIRQVMIPATRKPTAATAVIVGSHQGRGIIRVSVASTPSVSRLTRNGNRTLAALCVFREMTPIQCLTRSCEVCDQSPRRRPSATSLVSSTLVGAFECSSCAARVGSVSLMHAEAVAGVAEAWALT